MADKAAVLLTQLRHGGLEVLNVLFRSKLCPFKIESLRASHNIFVSRYQNSCLSEYLLGTWLGFT